jgi:hypothetical protein
MVCTISIRWKGYVLSVVQHFATLPNVAISPDGQQFIPRIIVLLSSSLSHSPMNTNAFLSFLLSLSIRTQRIPSLLPPWRVHLEAFAHSTFLRLWQLYKFAFRVITGQGAIERLCHQALRVQTSKMDVKEIELDTREVRNVIWRIGTCS